MSFVVIVLLAVAALAVYGFVQSKNQAEKKLADAREEAQRWYERLGGQTMNLVAPSDNTAAKQALVDAGERYTAAGSQMERATSTRQFELAADTALEGLHYVRAAREAMDMDPGPEVPPTSAQNKAGSVKERIEAEVEGKQVSASPKPDSKNQHYYPGGTVEGKPVPAGWYSEPWWRSAMGAGVGALGAMMIFNALIMPAMYSGAVDGGDEGAAADGADDDMDDGDGGDMDDGGGDFDFGGFDF